MKRLLTTLIIILISFNVFADRYTDNYKLVIWDEGSRNWHDKISRDILSIDSVMGILSGDNNNFLKLDGTNTPSAAYNWSTDLTTTGEIGIGTTSPLTDLHIESDATTSYSQVTVTDSTRTHGMSFFSGRSGGSAFGPAIIWSSGESLRFGGGVTDFNTTTGFTKYMEIEDGGNIIVENTLSADILSTDAIGTPTGTLTLGGYGQTNNANITLDFESDANRVLFDSTSDKIPKWEMNQVIADSTDILFGSGSDVRLRWVSVGNDNMQIGTQVNTATSSGYISITEKADTNNANRSPLGLSANPVLRVYSSDQTEPNDFIEISHDQTDAHISVGNGLLKISADGVDLFNDYDVDDEAEGGKLRIYRNAAEGDRNFEISVSKNQVGNLNFNNGTISFGNSSTRINFGLNGNGDTYFYSSSGAGENKRLFQMGYVDSVAEAKGIKWIVQPDGMFKLDQINSGIQNFTVKLPISADTISCDTISCDGISMDSINFKGNWFDDSAPTDNYVFKFDSATNTFTLEEDSTGSGYFNRSGTVITPAVAGDTISVDVAGALIVSGDTTLATLNIDNSYDMPVTNDFVVKAWASVTYAGGTPTLQDSLNVSGITDTNTGRLTVTWDDDFADANYSAVSDTYDASGDGDTHITSIAAGSIIIDINSPGGTALDPDAVYCMAIGDQ